MQEKPSAKADRVPDDSQTFERWEIRQIKADRFDNLLAFLQRLKEAKIFHRLSYRIHDAVSVEVYVPGEHWEIDFFADGEVYVERFRSDGRVGDASELAELFAKHSAAALPNGAEPLAAASPANSVSPRKVETARSSSKK